MKNNNEWISVRTKIKKENYIELEKYCKAHKDLTISYYIRTLIEKNKPSEVSLKKAGAISFKFNPQNDNFSFEINYDDGEKENIGEELSLEFLESLKKAIKKGITERDEHIKKKLNSSVSVSNLKKLKGKGENVKA